MARKEEVEIYISEDGEIKFHIKGIKGPKCVDVAKKIEKALGKIKDMDYTSEYYEKEETQTEQKHT